MIAAFEFVEGGRTFSCSVEGPTATREAWWWFSVSCEAHQRFAPFRASADDTAESVRARVTAYYNDLLERRKLPAVSHWQRGRRPGAPAATPAPVATPAPAAEG